ncbi:aminotransferase class V-fold PLP-dependent enzyme [Rhodococcus sp. NPDC058521]|uniref:aminotransferase class V-fold PLP-dependent enzyme n=1 Tax=Rhodococcus sp. NPDC058521 TaxID=3346536 RepID=UPI003654C718
MSIAITHSPIPTESATETLARLTGWHSRMREQFPIITAHPDLAYLDSSATAQKPQAVLDAVGDYLVTSNANAGRGTYGWANATTDLVDAGRESVHEFLHDDRAHPSSVTFVDGASSGLRKVAQDWLIHNLDDGDEIIVPFADHQANALPWLEVQQMLAARGRTVTVHPLPYEESGSGDYDIDAFMRLLGPRTRFVAATHVHHVYGNDMNVHRIRNACGSDTVICLDAAQSVGHMDVDVSTLDVDFVVFSGHKAMALPGIGAVWARNARGAAFESAGWPGSPNTTGIVSLRAAFEWLNAAGLQKVHAWTSSLGAVLTDGLSRLDSYEVLGCQSSLTLDSQVQRRLGTVTFRHRDVSSNDLGFVLDSRGFMVRADGHCQARAGEDSASVRVSLHVYNTEDEVDRLLGVLTELDGAA